MTVGANEQYGSIGADSRIDNGHMNRALRISRNNLPQRKSALHDVGQGLSYVARSPVVGGLILLSIIPFLFGLSINTLLPAFNTDVLRGGPDDLGILMTGMGVGAIVGSLLFYA